MAINVIENSNNDYSKYPQCGICYYSHWAIPVQRITKFSSMSLWVLDATLWLLFDFLMGKHYLTGALWSC